MKSQKLICGVMAAFLASTIASAGQGQAVHVDIASQPVDHALSALAQQTGLQILFPAGDSLESRQAPSVMGDLTPVAALRTLLSGTGLEFEFVNARTVAIRQPIEAEANSAGSAVAETDAAALYAAEQADGTASSRQIPEVLVSGASTLNVDIERTKDDVQPYVVFDREEIERSGASNMQDLLKTRLAMNYVAFVSPQIGAQATPGNASYIAVRGLGREQTIILMDGDNTGSGQLSRTNAPTNPDRSPLSAVERVEVLPTSAAAIYGGSATGGVVNVIRKRDYSDVGLKTGYQDSIERAKLSTEISTRGGTTLAGARSALLFSGSYSHAVGLSSVPQLLRSSLAGDLREPRGRHNLVHDPSPPPDPDIRPTAARRVLSPDRYVPHYQSPRLRNSDYDAEQPLLALARTQGGLHE
jgi:iron complex outermembrane recepter protein